MKKISKDSNLKINDTKNPILEDRDSTSQINDILLDEQIMADVEES